MQENEDHEGMIVFKTDRLQMRTVRPEDTKLLYRLWTHPEVMKNVGFPRGLMITEEDISEQTARQKDSVYDRYLIVEITGQNEAIGECKLGYPNDKGISITDVKLLPQYWGNKYGVEIKRGLLRYLFENTDCKAVEASPNVANIASIKMQEAVGGVRIGEDTYHFPEHMKEFTTPVHVFIYRVTRESWDQRK